MNNKVIKYKSSLSKEEITFTIDENLNKLKGRELAPKKLAEANRILGKLKSPLPR
jgi:hypothetical protein